MRFAIVTGAMLSVVSTTAFAANPERDAVKAVIKAVKQGEELSTAFPGAVSAKEAALLKRVAKCSANNLMKHKDGSYTALWNCGSKGMLGMEVSFTRGKITSISTMEVSMRPNTGR